MSWKRVASGLVVAKAMRTRWTVSRMAVRVLGAEMDHHLVGEDEAANVPSGYGKKTVVTGGGKIDLKVPRDRQASFDSQLIGHYQRRFPDFDDKTISI